MKSQPVARILVLIAALALLGGAAAVGAEERHERGERQDRGERREVRGQPERHEVHDRYQARHWVYDNRYQHGRYYPVPGYSVSVLPPGNVGISFGRGHFFFHAGVWYRPGPSGFVVVRPPIGIAVPVLPLGYSALWLGGVPYYYANDVYYSGGPGNYVVVAPPAADAIETAPSLPPPVASPSAPAQTPGTWYYCDAAKAYYPYVTECKEGWRAVPATPPAGR